MINNQDQINVNHEFISEVIRTSRSDQLTPPSTRVEVVDQIKRIARKGSTKLQLSEQAITKLRRTWEQKEAKQRQQGQQEKTLITTQCNNAKAKMIRKLQHRLASEPM